MNVINTVTREASNEATNLAAVEHSGCELLPDGKDFIVRRAGSDHRREFIVVYRSPRKVGATFRKFVVTSTLDCSKFDECRVESIGGEHFLIPHNPNWEYQNERRLRIETPEIGYRIIAEVLREYTLPPERVEAEEKYKFLEYLRVKDSSIRMLRVGFLVIPLLLKLSVALLIISVAVLIHSADTDANMGGREHVVPVGLNDDIPIDADPHSNLQRQLSPSLQIDIPESDPRIK